MTARSWLPAGAGAAALVLLASLVGPGCQRMAPLPADTLVIGQLAEPKSLDPQVATALNDFRIAANLYDGLVRFRSGTLEIEPALAESWSVEDAGRTYRFHLRKGVQFHDGTPFDSAAVRFHFERLLDEDHAYHDTGPFPLAFFFDCVTGIETPDAQTVIFRLEEPFAPLLSNLASPSGFLVSPTAVQKYGKNFGRHPVGTGPFVFDGWESNRLVRLKKNRDYWDGPPRLETVIFRPLTDENARLTELLAGGCDLIVEVPPDMVNLFRREKDFRVLEAAGPHLWFLILNIREGPFQDSRMRRAVNLAIDRQSLVRELLQDTATVPAGPIPGAFTWAVDPNLKPFPYDPERARKLIADAGYEGATLTLLATEGGSGMLAPKEMAAAIQADLAEVGLKVQIETFEWNTFLARVNDGLAGQADMAQMAWMVNDPDTLPFLALRTEAWPERGGFNSGYYSNPEVDRLLVQARKASDRGVRGDLYRRIQRLVREDAPWVFVASWKQNAVVNVRVRGVVLQPSFLLLLKDAWKEPR